MGWVGLCIIPPQKDFSGGRERMIDEESFSTLWKLVNVNPIDLSLICRSGINGYWIW